MSNVLSRSETRIGLDYREFFNKLTGFYPHAYQERMEERLRAGESVLLRVPTGAGKTWAAVAPFLYSLSNCRRIADRLLYALPLRSLASSLHSTVYEKIGGVFGEVQAVGNDREYSQAVHYCSLQIGGQKDDTYFQSDLTFTTIDQLLSSYVFIPVSLPDRVGNINAGALIGSLLVFDEIHLLDSSIALGTVIEMLERLRGLCQFVLMTATTSDRAISWLARRLSATHVDVTEGEIRALPSQRTKQRTWRWCGQQIAASAVSAEHDGGRTIVLLNSVQRAQDLFLALEDHYESEPYPPRLFLLHSRFYPEDRKAVEDELPAYFGPKATQTNVILVTTQVIEAGMDLSADTLHCELAPMNALIQRAGRTARYEDRSIGFVIVYEVPGLGPYKDTASLVEATRTLLQSLPSEGRVIDFIEELARIESIHAPAEENDLKRHGNLRERRDAVHKAMDQGDRGTLSELVRNIDSIGVVIAEEPKTLFEGRAWPRLLSVSGFSLMSLSRHFQDLAPGRWVAKGAIEQDSDQRPGITLEWEILSAGRLRAQWLVAIHPDFASYKPRLGLRLGESGSPPPVVYSEVPLGQHYDYQFEPWVEHSERIIGQVRVMESSYACGVQLLAARHRVPEEWVRQLVEIICALHDTGKLALEWQWRAWLWQDDKDARARTAGLPVPIRPRVPIAHTWFESDVDRGFRRDPRYKFPPHAAEGALALFDSFTIRFTEIGGEKWGDLAARCAVSAIARHHGTRTHSCTPFRFAPDSARLAASASPLGGSDLQLLEGTDPLLREQFPEILLTFGRETDEPAWALYAFLARRLRLADQAATIIST